MLPKIFSKLTKWHLLLLLFVCCSIVWYAVFAESRSGLLKVSILDIGQGDAIFIEAPNGNQVLLDGGPNRSVLSELGKVMSFYDKTIDMIMVSNPDKDHIAGFIEVLKKFKISDKVEPGTQTATAIYSVLTDLASTSAIRNTIARIGQDIVLDKKRGVVISVLFPDRDVSGLNTNDGSIVAKLSYGNTCFILTGDAPLAIEEYLVKIYGENLDCDVLKVGHHGSRTSTSPAFVSAV